jgi:FtsP/CotA-like multicopper oxidase with cupredoxin domain/peroxiredoxin
MKNGLRLAATVALLGATGVGNLRLAPATTLFGKEVASRVARRPKAARVQTNLDLAKKSQNEFREPSELTFQNFNELTLRVGTFDDPNAAQLSLPSRFQLLCYNGLRVGPTIRVRRGTTFHIHLENALPVPGPEQPPDINNNNEQPHKLCTTNLHTHGLHIGPSANNDNIFVCVPPQKDFTYEYTVPADHPAGTFWYHPHNHGSVAYQLSNGLAGALIVEGSRHDGIPDLDDNPEIAAAQERIFVFQLYNYRVDTVGSETTARIDAKTIYDVKPNNRSCQAVPVPDSDPTDQGQATAINGVINPVIRLAPGEVERWRLIHAAWDVDRQLYLTDESGKPTADLVFQEIALDGLATGTMVAKGNDPKNQNSAPLLELAPGQRSDALIQAPRLKFGEKERTFLLRQSAQNPQAPENLILAKIVVSGRPRQMRLPDPSTLARYQPFAPIRDDELATTGLSEIATKGLAFFASASGATNPRFWINKKTFSHYKTSVQIRVDTAEEWKITAVSQDHPFHVHVNPFQVVMRTDSNGNNPKPMNVWRDTLFIHEGETYTIRSRFRDYLGKSVLHCHLLDHEDQGMMMPIEFIPPYQTPVNAVVTQMQTMKLKPTAVATPSLELPDPSGTKHALADYRGRNVVLVFFRGLECSHCAGQLARLVSTARLRIGAHAEIVAVSSEPIPDAQRAATMLGSTAADRIHLLVDLEHRAFRAFGCYKDVPLHGLFVIDRRGVIRASYSGEVPFDDVEGVASQVQLLASRDANQTSPSKQ